MPELVFDKGRRLLSGIEFQSVFDSARFKVSHRHFLLLARPSGRAAPRLGLVVGKKNLRRAVDRNRVKRLARETFRHHQRQLDSLDVVFLARKGLETLEPADQNRALNDAWAQLAAKLVKS